MARLGAAIARRGGLWSHEDFLRLWAARTVSGFGTEVTVLAIPLIAIVTLDATPFEVGLMVALRTLPYSLFGLFAGVLADRLNRRQILIWADLGRAVLLAVLPLAWWLDLLSLPLLIAVVFLNGTLAITFDITAQSYLPEVVRREQLIDANGKFAISGAGARIAGPGLGGLLVEILTAPLAVAVDILSFLWSALLIGRMGSRSKTTSTPRAGSSVVQEIREGVAFVWRHAYIRPIACCSATIILAVGMAEALLILFATRELGISAGLLGLLLTGSGLGGLIGARFAGSLSARLGVGRAITVAVLITAVGAGLVPLAMGGIIVAAAIIVVSRVVYTIGTFAYDITHVSFRQAITPDELLGRMNATIRVGTWAVYPLGGLLGGILGEVLGLRPTLALSAAVIFLAAFWIVFSDVRKLRSLAAVEGVQVT